MELYIDNNLIKEIELEKINLGQGLVITLENVLISQLNINNLSLEIKSDFNELSKKNNKIELEIKK
jgi:hypothetical protein